MLSKRLETIKEFVDTGSKVGDIGADHGKLIIDLVKSNITSFAYASDNKKGPFESLSKAVARANLNGKIIIRLTDGLNLLPKEIDTIILSGMGGDLVISILENGKNEVTQVETIIVSCHTQIENMRRYVCSQGFYISKEEIVFDKHYYEIIKFERGHKEYNDDDYAFGPLLRRDKNFIFCTKYQKRKNDILRLLHENISLKRKETLLKELERIDNL